MAYAERTSVSVEKSMVEIERLVTKHGAGQFIRGWEAETRAMIGFSLRGRQVRFVLPLPSKDDPAFAPRRRRGRTFYSSRNDAHEAECRRRWRALVLVIKAKLEAVDSGITSFDEEFLAHIMTPDNRTIGDHVIHRLDEMYASGTMQPLLPSTTGA